MTAPAVAPVGCWPNASLFAAAALTETLALPVIDGAALYQAGIFEIRGRVRDNFTLFANYTYSKAHDNVTDFNSDYGPNDQTNLAAEWSLSTFDQRHKVVVAAVGNGDEAPSQPWPLKHSLPVIVSLVSVSDPPVSMPPPSQNPTSFPSGLNDSSALTSSGSVASA